MITDWYIERRGEAILLGIKLEQALLEIVTDHDLLTTCLALLESPHTGSVHTRMGQFGDCPITLNLHHDDSVSIFIDGPDFDPPRNQSAAIWLDKKALHSILQKADTKN
jgi:hypothetical protein